MDYDPDAHTLQCPKCGHGMEEISHSAGVTIDRCTHCKGIWFDNDEAAKLKSLADGHKLDTGSPKEGWKWDSRADINCPRCHKPMGKSADPKQKHIWYEVCFEHGMFMDAGEFTDYKFESLADVFRSFIKGNRSTTAP